MQRRWALTVLEFTVATMRAEYTARAARRRSFPSCSPSPATRRGRGSVCRRGRRRGRHGRGDAQGGIPRWRKRHRAPAGVASCAGRGGTPRRAGWHPSQGGVAPLAGRSGIPRRAEWHPSQGGVASLAGRSGIPRRAEWHPSQGGVASLAGRSGIPRRAEWHLPPGGVASLALGRGIPRHGLGRLGITPPSPPPPRCRAPATSCCRAR